MHPFVLWVKHRLGLMPALSHCSHTQSPHSRPASLSCPGAVGWPVSSQSSQLLALRTGERTGRQLSGTAGNADCCPWSPAQTIRMMKKVHTWNIKREKLHACQSGISLYSPLFIWSKIDPAYLRNTESHVHRAYWSGQPIVRPGLWKRHTGIQSPESLQRNDCSGRVCGL